MAEFKRTDNGIKIWDCEVNCLCSDEKFGTIGIKSPKSKKFIATINFTPSGIVEIWQGQTRILRVSRKDK